MVMPTALLLSVTVTVKLTGEPFVDGGIPLSRPAEDSVSQAGRNPKA